MDQEKEAEAVKVVKTSTENTQHRCPSCGSTEVSLDPKTGMLKCRYCRTEFSIEQENSQAEGFVEELDTLSGTIIGEGAQDIQDNASQLVTIKCRSCGAEVVVNTEDSLTARCHWCRNILSVGEKLSNGAVPDVLLPFSIGKEEAIDTIRNYVSKKRFFIDKVFKKEFQPENVNGVYMPYMLVDVNAHADLKGRGQKLKRRYTVDDGKRTYYDADEYAVERSFDLTVDDLTVESSSDRLVRDSSEKTNNIINAILPFDTENCIPFQAEYMKGFSSERRDVNVDHLTEKTEQEVRDIARIDMYHDTKDFYNRGIHWDSVNVEIKGTQWKTAYLPIWLYSYLDKKNEDTSGITRYIAVNARTKEVCGSVPLNHVRLVVCTVALFIMQVVLALTTMLDLFLGEDGLKVLLFTALVIIAITICFYGFIRESYYRTRNRHYHESETKHFIKNLKKTDTFLKTKKRLTSSEIDGKNDTRIEDSHNRTERM